LILVPSPFWGFAHFGSQSKTAFLQPGVAVGMRACPVSASATQTDTSILIVFVSRHRELVAADQHGVVSGIALGAAFVIASLSSERHTYMDSVNVAVVTFPASGSL